MSGTSGGRPDTVKELMTHRLVGYDTDRRIIEGMKEMGIAVWQKDGSLAEETEKKDHSFLKKSRMMFDAIILSEKEKRRSVH